MWEVIGCGLRWSSRTESLVKTGSQGFGSQCLDHATAITSQRDCYKIMLLTGADAEWKHEFYEACGFDRDTKTGFVRDFRE